MTSKPTAVTDIPDSTNSPDMTNERLKRQKVTPIKYKDFVMGF